MSKREYNKLINVVYLLYIMFKNIIADLKSASSPEKAKVSMRFFKTGKGHYGEGDVFIGVTVPETRSIAAKYKNTSINDIKQLLESKIHEHRLCALIILMHHMKQAVKEKNETRQKEIFNFTIEHKKHLNNWDLVDVSTPTLIGQYLENKSKAIIYKLAQSENLWDKRIGI